MARRPSRGPTVTLPERLTAAMRADWRKVDGWAQDEQQDEVWTALKRHAVRVKDGDHGD